MEIRENHIKIKYIGGVISSIEHVILQHTNTHKHLKTKLTKNKEMSKAHFSNRSIRYIIVLIRDRSKMLETSKCFANCMHIVSNEWKNVSYAVCIACIPIHNWQAIPTVFVNILKVYTHFFGKQWETESYLYMFQVQNIKRWWNHETEHLQVLCTWIDICWHHRLS